jgi:hypothetical protein
MTLHRPARVRHPIEVMTGSAAKDTLDGMLIALLAVLAVDLAVVVVLLAFVLSRRRWVERRPASLRGVIRVSGGEVDGLRPKWGRGYGSRVSDVLVWTKAPFMFRTAFVATAGLNDQRPAHADEVKRLGDHPVVIELTAVEVAARDEHRHRLRGPYSEPVAAAVAAEPTAVV